MTFYSLQGGVWSRYNLQPQWSNVPVNTSIWAYPTVYSWKANMTPYFPKHVFFFYILSFTQMKTLC
jgi:hypothetical protein